MSRPLVISLVCNSVFGLVNFRSALVRAWVGDGHRVVVVAPMDGDPAPIVALGAEFVPWPVSGRSASLRRELRSLAALVSIYRTVRPDLTFHYTIKPVIYGAIACRLLGLRCISVITGLGYVFLNSGWVSCAARSLYGRTLRWSSEVWFLNEEDRETFREAQLVNDAKVRILPGEGIDMRFFSAAPRRGASTDGFVFLLIARLLRDKGVHEYVAAARALRDRGRGARFQLLGAADSDNPSAIGKAQIEQWEREGVVEYLGTTPDVRPAIEAADCIVLPSYREGVPRVLLEAACMRRPVVATDVAGCREVVVHGETGFLCKARDADDLATQMTRMLDTPPEARRHMGENARSFVAARFDDRIVIEHYRRALERAGLRARGSTS